MRLFFARLFSRGTTHLYRAVSMAEYEDILLCGRFRNPIGLECKYFARTRRQAAIYARLAIKAYGDRPLIIVRARISTTLVDVDMCAEIENGIQVIVVPTDILSAVSPPRVVEQVSHA